MYGPCGILNPINICMAKNNTCKNGYSKKFAPNTAVGVDCFPLYKRPNNVINVKIRGKILDNRWVVPYNPYLVTKFNCHINVKICSTIKSVKYLYKYIYRGHDCVAFNLIDKEDYKKIDEIQNFQSARWITPPEPAWRIYGFTLNEMYPSVYSLQLHLEDQHLVAFHSRQNLINILNLDFYTKSMLTQFFQTNQGNTNACKLLCRKFPKHFVWNHHQKLWTYRKKEKSVIGRIITANSFEGERYYLRIL